MDLVLSSPGSVYTSFPVSKQFALPSFDGRENPLPEGQIKIIEYQTSFLRSPGVCSSQYPSILPAHTQADKEGPSS